MLKLCMLISDSNFSNAGGEQRVVTNIANILAGDFEIDFYCNFSSDVGLYYPLDGRVNVINISNYAPIKEKNFLSSFLRWFNYRTAFLEKFHLTEAMKQAKFSDRLAGQWITMFNEKKYDRLVGISMFWGMFMLLHGSKIKGKCYSWFHNTYDAYFNSEKRYLWGYKSLLDYTSSGIEKLIVLTEEDRRCYYEKHQIPTCAIPNPLSFECEQKSDLKARKLIFVGRLQIKQKGLDYLVKVIELVFKKNNDWEIDIVGDGDDMSYLQEEVEKRHWGDRVHLLGSQSNVAAYYLEASVFLLTSRWEGFGLVVTEAMECGLPVVSFTTSGPSEIITDSIDGYLIEKYDTSAFAEKVLYLMDHEKVRYQMGRNAAIKAKHYSAENIKQTWLELLEDKG